MEGVLGMRFIVLLLIGKDVRWSSVVATTDEAKSEARSSVSVCVSASL